MHSRVSSSKLPAHQAEAGSSQTVVRVTNWSKEETKTVIAIWSDEDTQTATDDPFTRNKKIYNEIAKKMTAMGYARTASQIKYKIQSLKQKYKKVLEQGRVI